MKNKKNAIIGASVFLLVVIAVIAIGFIASKKDNSLRSDDDGKLVVGFDAEFPPYGYMDSNGEYVGFDLSLTQEVCARNGWELVKRPIEWNSKDMELKSGSIDCIWNGFTVNGREKDYTWSSAYVDNSQVIVVKKNSGINELSDLKGKIVAVQTDSAALAAFEGEDATKENIELKNTFKALEQIGDYNSAFMTLESGLIDAVCMDLGVANYELKLRGDTFKKLEENVSTEQYAVGFRKGNTALRDKVEETLIQMKNDGTFDKIAAQWELSDCVCLGKEGSDRYLEDSSADGNNAGMNILDICIKLAGGMLSSLLIFVLTLTFALPLGLIIMSFRRSNLKVVSWFSKIYISIMRGTPLMLQLLVVFYGPYYLFGVNLSYSYRFIAVIIGFSINYAAYFAEIYRSGIQSIPVGQYEAALILGYSKAQTFWKIIFPQMVKIILPAVTNEVMTLVKDTSLAFALAYTEMFTLAKQISAANASILPLFVAGIFYYISNFLVAVIMSKIELKMDRYKI